MKSCSWFSALNAAGASLFAIAAISSAADVPKPVEVKVTRPTRGEIVRYVTLPGSVRANQMATLYAKVPGYLKSISVDKGDTVNAGQPLAEIEVPELSADLARQRAELARAEAEVKVAAIEFMRLDKAQKKASDLVTPLAVDAADGRLAVAKANVNVARSALERTETLLGFSKLTAPFAGVVTARFVDPGAFIPAATSGSAASSAAVVTLMDFNIVRVQVPVTELEAPLVARGQPVKVSVEGLPGRTFEGMVSRLAFALDEATKTMLVEADLPNPKLELRPGMYATVKVGVEKHTDALTIPVEALVMEKVNAFAFIADDGKAKKTAIKIGFNDGAKVEVLDGLKGGEAVILVGKATLADGAAVNAMEAR
ncbi:MAG TPA: efflux RND transporter periplasmic adaptor subunit [Verrucomicrobiae bacterium]|jgi:RND family efflux transporter MFP subunit